MIGHPNIIGSYALRITHYALRLAPPSLELDPSRQSTAREYSAIRRRLFFLDMALNGILLVVLIPSGFSVLLRDFAESLNPLDAWGGTVVIYVVLLGAGYVLLNLPLDYYSGFVLRHRYGLSRQSLGAWLSDQLKELVLGGVLGLIALLGIYGVLRYLPDYWWIVMSVVMLLFTIVLAQLAPVILMPLFNKLTPLPGGELKDRLLRMAAKAGSPVRGVFVMDMSRRSNEANAMFTGIGPTRRIILGDTMLDRYSEDEIETVLAHELAHQVHGDLWRGIALQAALTVSGFWLVDLGLRAGVGLFGLRGIADIAGLPLMALIFTVFGLLLLPLTNAFSRYMERSADSYALRVTNKPAAFRAVMLKLSDQNLADANPPAWVSFLFYSHPPISERVAMAEAYAATPAGDS